MNVLILKNRYHETLDDIYGIEEVNSLFFLSLGYVCGVTRIQLQLEPELTIAKSETNQLLEVLELLKQHKPIQYIFGETDFFGLKFKVNKHVLIPRQETEELVALILNDIKKLEQNQEQLTILDIGTGSGCIAISLAKNLPKARVFALDISEKALEIARHNAKQNNINVTFIEANILDKSIWDSVFLNSEFDIIVSNPPYVRNSEKEEIKSNVLDNEPHLALFVSDENPLIFYKTITEFAKNNLRPNGSLCFEINQYLGEETMRLLENSIFENVELLKDLNGNNRIVKGIKG